MSPGWTFKRRFRARRQFELSVVPLSEYLEGGHPTATHFSLTHFAHKPFACFSGQMIAQYLRLLDLLFFTARLDLVTHQCRKCLTTVENRITLPIVLLPIKNRTDRRLFSELAARVRGSILRVRVGKKNARVGRGGATGAK